MYGSGIAISLLRFPRIAGIDHRTSRSSSINPKQRQSLKNLLEVVHYDGCGNLLKVKQACADVNQLASVQACPEQASYYRPIIQSHFPRPCIARPGKTGSRRASDVGSTSSHISSYFACEIETVSARRDSSGSFGHGHEARHIT
jgi:hypothetical protein